jgi:hypothetical protein
MLGRQMEVITPINAAEAEHTSGQLFQNRHILIVNGQGWVLKGSMPSNPPPAVSARISSHRDELGSALTLTK